MATDSNRSATWELRRLTASWAERCADVSARAIDATWPEDERHGIVAARLRTPDVWKQYFAERTVFGACDQEGTLLGIATVHRAGDIAYLGAHSVVRRRCGIGTALTVARLDEARRWGCTHVVALIAPSNAASAANLTAQGFACIDSGPDGSLRYIRAL